jgi:hypothetical protein
MDKINILNKRGFLTNEERKEKFVHGCSDFTFETCLDLTEPVKVIPYGSRKQFTVNEYSTNVAEFISYWNTFVLEDLNGFSGFSNVKFELVGFELVQ